MQRSNPDSTGIGLSRVDWAVLVGLVASVIMIADWGLLSANTGSAWGGRPAWQGFLSFVGLIGASSLVARAFWKGWHCREASFARLAGLLFLWFIVLAGAFTVIMKASEPGSQLLPHTLSSDEREARASSTLNSNGPGPPR